MENVLDRKVSEIYIKKMWWKRFIDELKKMEKPDRGSKDKRVYRGERIEN